MTVYTAPDLSDALPDKTLQTLRLLWECAPSSAHLIAVPKCPGAAQTLKAHAPKDIHIMPHHPCTVVFPRGRKRRTCLEHISLKIALLSARSSAPSARKGASAEEQQYPSFLRNFQLSTLSVSPGCVELITS